MPGEHECSRYDTPFKVAADSYRELSRLIAAEIDALGRDGHPDESDVAIVAAPKRLAHDHPSDEAAAIARHNIAGISEPERDFVELVAVWLRRRPAKRDLLRWLSDAVLPEDTLADAAATNTERQAPDGGGDLVGVQSVLAPDVGAATSPLAG